MQLPGISFLLFCFPECSEKNAVVKIQMAGVTVKASPYAKLSEFSLNQEALYIYTGGPGLFKSRQKKNLLIYLFIKMTFCGSLNLKSYEIVVYQSISWSGTVAWQPGPVLKVLFFSPLHPFNHHVVSLMKFGAATRKKKKTSTNTGRRIIPSDSRRSVTVSQTWFPLNLVRWCLSYQDGLSRCLGNFSSTNLFSRTSARWHAGATFFRDTSHMSRAPGI